MRSISALEKHKCASPKTYHSHYICIWKRKGEKNGKTDFVACLIFVQTINRGLFSLNSFQFLLSLLFPFFRVQGLLFKRILSNRISTTNFLSEFQTPTILEFISFSSFFWDKRWIWWKSRSKGPRATLSQNLNSNLGPSVENFQVACTRPLRLVCLSIHGLVHPSVCPCFCPSVSQSFTRSPFWIASGFCITASAQLQNTIRTRCNT